MELDSKNLARLRRVADPRKVWTSESGDFTPWLAENIDVLADELGLTLTVIGTEIPVGEFRVDIRAEDDEGRPVVIENQLERTDHNHLGQCLVYASGLEASTVIWITTQFRDDFRQALDWLNERTDASVRFFGVEVGVVQIGDSGPAAPMFEVVSRPNDWQKQTKQATTGGSPTTPLDEARQDLFAEVLDIFLVGRPEVRRPARATGNWIEFANGPFGRWALTGTGDRVRVEAYLDCGNKERNKALIDTVIAEADHWNTMAGTTLTYEHLDDKRASRIAAYRNDVDLDNPSARAELRNWAAATLDRMYTAMNEPLRTRATELRSLAGDADPLTDVPE